MTENKEGSMNWKISKMWDALFGNGREGVVIQIASLRSMMRLVIFLLFLVLSGVVGMSIKSYLSIQ